MPKKFQTANRDITYCTNYSCKQREDCFRCQENYENLIKDYYSFCEFNEENCEKGCIKRKD